MERETFFKCFDMLKKLGSDYGYITFSAPFLVFSFPYYMFKEYENKRGFLDREITHLCSTLNKVFRSDQKIHQIRITVNEEVIKRIITPIDRNNIDDILLTALNELVTAKLIKDI